MTGLYRSGLRTLRRARAIDVESYRAQVRQSLEDYDRILVLRYVNELASSRRRKRRFQFDKDCVRIAKGACREYIHIIYRQGFVDVGFQSGDGVSWFRYTRANIYRMIAEVFDCEADPLGGRCFHWPDPEPEKSEAAAE